MPRVGSCGHPSRRAADLRFGVIFPFVLRTIVALVMALSLPVFAAPAPLRAPVNTNLSDTLVVVEDVLQRFEETAASHHVLLTGAAAARRTAALRLVRLARYHVVYDETMALRFLGWAASFPHPEWYGAVLPREHYAIVLQAARMAGSHCESSCAEVTPLPPTTAASPRSVPKRPYIQPNQIVKNEQGGYDTVLDFIHYPPEVFEVTVRAEGQPAIDGKVLPGQTKLQVPSSLGSYEVTARLQSGDTTHRYRAASIVCGRDGLQVNGIPTTLKMVRLLNLPAVEPGDGRSTIESLRQRGVNVAFVFSPPTWFLALASETGLGLAVGEAPVEASRGCSQCPAENAIESTQVRLAAHMATYVESPAVWFWVAAAAGDHPEADVEIAVPAYRQLDPYERPVLALVDTALPPAHDLGIFSVSSQDVYTATDLEAPMKRARENDITLLVEITEVADAIQRDTIWRDALALGYAGGIVETLDFSTRTPPAP